MENPFIGFTCSCIILFYSNFSFVLIKNLIPLIIITHFIGPSHVALLIIPKYTSIEVQDLLDIFEQDITWY